MLTAKQAVKKIKNEYPHGVDLCYVDYRENLNDDAETIEEIMQTGYADSLSENSLFDDTSFDTINELINQTFTEDEQNEISQNEELAQTIKDAFFEIDTSNPIADLISNTGRRYMYYDLNFEIENCDGQQDVEKQAKSIAKFLHVSYKKHEKSLCELTDNAGYGGSLVILFNEEPKIFYQKNLDKKYIEFIDNFSLCIMNRNNGSGHDVEITANKKYVPLAFNFTRENLHDDRGASGYSYSHDVCGLCLPQCATSIRFIDRLAKKTAKIPVSTNEQAKAFKEREDKYVAAFKAGKCTFGDMKYARHRNTEYINNYPCGTKCKDCGTFWID